MEAESGRDDGCDSRVAQVGSAAEFLEFNGDRLGTFQDVQNRDEQLMAVLGVRVLFNTKRLAESAEAMQLRMVSED